jgi:hypothetical protein
MGPVGHLIRQTLAALVPSRSIENIYHDTASSFAADVHRYLHDEPVQACPPSAD